MPRCETEAPRVGDSLPRAQDAAIDPAKLCRYALDPHHPVGKHKAIVFARALGITPDDWEYLREAILEQLPANRTLVVVTAWEMIDGRPELVTTRVAPSTRQ